MKNLRKITLCFLLVAALLVTVSACKKEEAAPTTEKQLYVPTTPKPTDPDETTPIYSRPSEDEEDGEQGTESDDPENPENPENPNEDEDTDQGDGDQTPDGGSQGGEGSSNDDGDGVEGTVSTPEVSAKPLTWANINSFTTNITSLSTTQARQLCVDFFRYAKTATWTPDKSFNYVKNAKGSKDNMVGGQLYGGLPYVGNASGNIYRLMDYINESTGKVDLADALNLTGGELSTTDLRYFGNQCANGAYIGWGRVINSVTLHYTAAMTKANGYLPIGPYTYDETISAWKDQDGYRTTDIAQSNGEQVMYASYAQLKIADGMVNYTTAGHVIMCSSAPVVVKNADGTINGDRSYTTIIDQAQKWVDATDDTGRNFKYKSGVDAKVSFKQLYSSGYLPYTFGEFNGTDPIEKPSASINVSGGSVTFSQLCKAQVIANYGVTDAYVIVTDSNGKEVYKHAVRNSSAYGLTLKMAASGAKVDSWGTLPTEGSYNVKVVVQLCTGQRPTVYSGTLAF